MLRGLLQLSLAIGVIGGASACKRTTPSALLKDDGEPSATTEPPAEPATLPGAHGESCGNGVVEGKEMCDDGAEGSFFCAADCTWRYCQVMDAHEYKEDEFPVATCIRSATGNASGGPVACTAAVADGGHTCYDCRGQLTPCERLGSSYQYAGQWRPPAQDKIQWEPTPSTPGDRMALADPEIAPDEAANKCGAYAKKQTDDGGVGPDKVPESPFRFGYDIDSKQLAKAPGSVEKWCLPKRGVNCGALLDSDWRAPKGCSCYADRRGRSYENCMAPDLFACPWASGSGCGLRAMRSCIKGPQPPADKPELATPQVATCHVDIVGTIHDFCCAKHWYGADRNSRQKTVCNGCTGEQTKACEGNIMRDTYERMSSFQIDTRVPCADEWRMAVAHNGFNTDWHWDRPVDTESRTTAEEVIANGGAAAILTAADAPSFKGSRKAEKGRTILDSSLNKRINPGSKVQTSIPLSIEAIAAFCQSNQVKLNKDGAYVCN